VYNAIQVKQNNLSDLADLADLAGFFGDVGHGSGSLISFSLRQNAHLAHFFLKRKKSAQPHFLRAPPLRGIFHAHHLPPLRGVFHPQHLFPLRGVFHPQHCPPLRGVIQAQHLIFFKAYPFFRTTFP
jgi:hypothetical protein